MIEKIVARRGFLRGLAVAPVAAQHIAAQATHRAIGIRAGAAGLAAAGGGLQPVPSSAQPRLFTNFMDWFTKFGDAQARREAYHVDALDPDIATFNVPITTQVRMQRERNYKRAVERRRERFMEEVDANGSFKWWG